MGRLFTPRIGAAALASVLAAGCAQGGAGRPEAPEKPRRPPGAAEAPAAEAGEPLTEAPGVGDRAPEVTVVGAGGERVALAPVWEDSSLVLIFYRGHW